MIYQAPPFNGLSQRTDVRLLREGMASEARDINLLHGVIRPVRSPLGIWVSAGLAKSFYRYCDQWLLYPSKIYFTETYEVDRESRRLIVVGDGEPMVRTCEGSEYLLKIQPPSFKPDVGLISADLSAYVFDIFGFYEGSDGSVYQRQAVSPSVVSAGKVYNFSTFSKATATPDDAVFAVSVEVRKSGELLGVVYSDNSFRLANSDLYLNSQKAKARLHDSVTGGVYEDVLPSVMQLRLGYVASSASSLSRAYVVTYVSYDGDETRPSVGSDIVVVDAANNIKVTGFSASSHPNVELMRLYRTDVDGVFRFVDEFPHTQLTYSDTKIDSELGEVLPSANWHDVPENLGGLVSMPNSFTVGFAGNTLYPSEVNQPHAFPSAYTKVIPDGDIVGMSGAFENSLVIMTTEHPYLATAYSPDNVTLTKVTAFEPCLSALSIVDMGSYGVGYASPNGFVIVRGGSARVFTEPFLTADQWMELDPASMRCGWYQNRLYIASDVDHLIFDMSERDDIQTRSSFVPSAFWVDVENNELMVIHEHEVKKWGKGDYCNFLWRSGETSFNKLVEFVKAKVEAKGAVDLILYAGGVEVHRSTVGISAPFHLPVLNRSKHWMFGVEGKHEVDKLVVTNEHRRL